MNTPIENKNKSEMPKYDHIKFVKNGLFCRMIVDENDEFDDKNHKTFIVPIKGKKILSTDTFHILIINNKIEVFDTRKNLDRSVYDRLSFWSQKIKGIIFEATFSDKIEIYFGQWSYVKIGNKTYNNTMIEKVC